MTSLGLKKGVMITHDNDKSKCDLAKRYLGYDALEAAGKLEEITIDNTWVKCLTAKDPRPFVRKIAAAAYRAHGGLLIVNINTVDAFAKCEYWRKLAKQESSLIDQFKFEGYVMLVVNVDWNEVNEYLDGNGGLYRYLFNDMNRFYYTF